MSPRSLLLFASVALFAACTHTPVANPDPNHIHADFAVWVNGTKLDFSDQHYMSEEYHEGDPVKPHANSLQQYLHLHDGNGHVMHSHKPGQTIGQFFGSIGLPMTKGCITLDTFQYDKLDAAWKSDFAIKPKLCDNGKFHWTFIVNGEKTALDPEYAFKDGDKILLSYSASDTAYQQEWKEMTDDACMYSKTCPWRGEPPTENCIADPTVPCVVQ